MVLKLECPIKTHDLKKEFSFFRELAGVSVSQIVKIPVRVFQLPHLPFYKPWVEYPFFKHSTLKSQSLKATELMRCSVILAGVHWFYAAFSCLT